MRFKNKEKAKWGSFRGKSPSLDSRQHFAVTEWVTPFELVRPEEFRDVKNQDEILAR